MPTEQSSQLTYLATRQTSLVNTPNGQEIPVPNRTVIGKDTTGPYHLVAREVQPTTGHADTMIVFAHGAAPINKDHPEKNSNPIELHAYFQDMFAEKGFASLVVNMRGVGKNVSVAKSLQIPMQSDRNYAAQSLNDRVDDFIATLFSLESSKNPPKQYIVSSVSMGADTAIRSLQKLTKIIGNETESADKRKMASAIVEKIRGVMLFAPAAYREETLTLPANSQQRTGLFRERKGREREFPLTDSPIFRDILTDRRYANPQSPYAIPLFLGGWTNDTVVAEAQELYKQQIPNKNDIVEIPGNKHEGLLSRQTAEANLILYQKATEFAKRVSI